MVWINNVNFLLDICQKITDNMFAMVKVGILSVNKVSQEVSTTCFYHSTCETSRGRVAARLSGLFYFLADETSVYRKKHTSANRCLTDFHLNRKTSVNNQSGQVSPHNTHDLSICNRSNPVAEGNQDGNVSHTRISMLTDLHLIHDENHVKQALWNYEYPAKSIRLRDFALSSLIN